MASWIDVRCTSISPDQAKLHYGIEISESLIVNAPEGAKFEIVDLLKRAASTEKEMRDSPQIAKEVLKKFHTDCQNAYDVSVKLVKVAPVSHTPKTERTSQSFIYDDF